MDISQLMQMAGQLKAKMEEAQADAEKVRVVGEAGGGMVKVTMNGRHEAVEVSIDPTAAGDVKLLEDLVRAAVNQATTRLSEELKGKFGGMAEGMGIDLSSLGFPGT